MTEAGMGMWMGMGVSMIAGVGGKFNRHAIR